MISRFLCLLAMSLLIMAGSTALVYGDWRGLVVAVCGAVLAAYAGTLGLMPDALGDDR
ncbi:MAG: hypothetical protein AAF586_03770 [Planctomycetota bacterium]